MEGQGWRKKTRKLDEEKTKEVNGKELPTPMQEITRTGSLNTVDRVG